MTKTEALKRARELWGARAYVDKDLGYRPALCVVGRVVVVAGKLSREVLGAGPDYATAMAKAEGTYPKI